MGHQEGSLEKGGRVGLFAYRFTFFFCGHVA